MNEPGVHVMAGRHGRDQVGKRPRRQHRVRHHRLRNADPLRRRGHPGHRDKVSLGHRIWHLVWIDARHHGRWKRHFPTGPQQRDAELAIDAIRLNRHGATGLEDKQISVRFANACE